MINLDGFRRRRAHSVAIGCCTIGSDHPIAVQSMTNTPTADVAASVAQIERIADAGAPIVRLTAQGAREGRALADITAAVRAHGYPTAIVADIHFTPDVAMIAAESVEIGRASCRERV